MISVTVQRDGTTLDLLLWRQHGMAGSALLEQTLDANPGLAGLGAELPLGTEVNLPDAPAPVRSQQVKVIDLFGES
jgi:phage tail protein X